MVESAVEQKNKSQEALVPLLYNKDDAHQLVQNPIQIQAAKLWQILCEKDTALTYQQAGTQTWVLLKRFFLLLFFLLTSLVALTFWFCGIGFRSGWQFRHWLEVEQPSIDEIISLVLKTFLLPLEYAFKWSEQFVKKYFGWELKIGHEAADTPTGTEEGSTSP
ncbi:MAG: hypothetical protein F6K11_28425 [Leptolyngbya sp. SIO3F4]|nr:hypothetical protein [Leptolyngbya sp. SIO3F4]